MWSPLEGPPAWASMRPERVEHVRRVVTLLDDWARASGVSDGERQRWIAAGWLHDALKDAPSPELTALLDPEFADAAPPLWHGPAAAARAARDGLTDQGVLDAVRYHTVGYVGWDDVGRLLFLADYLEPGRDFAPDDRAALVQRIATSLQEVDAVLRLVLAARMRHRRHGGRSVHPRTEEWWNALAR